MMTRLFLTINVCLLLCSCKAQYPAIYGSESPVAFPGAEGFGKFATGGRGGKVFIITNLNDDGEGSLRQAVTAKGPRIVVFAVSGTIHLQTALSIKQDITIAGQTAPGDGICIADQPVSLGGNNIIIRYLRFRLGDKFQNKGKVNGSGHDDALGGTRRSQIIIDHCSISWSTDECFSVYAGDSTTLQWNIISEPLNYSYHFETGDTDFERHGFGAIWGGKHLSAHHNLFAHCNNRTPRFDGIRNSPSEFVDFRNNVIYNWGSNNVHAGEGGQYNIVGNYYKYGPSTTSSKTRIAAPGKRDPDIPYGKWYVASNFVDESTAVTSNNWQGVHMMANGTEEDKKNTLVDKAFPAVEINTQSAEKAFEDVLRNAGASYRRDTLDKRIVLNVKNRTGGFIDVQGGYPHGTAYEATVNAWPVLKSMPAPADVDKDGMPDEWEKKNRLNPDINESDRYSLNKFYTNIEVYINSLTTR